LFCFYYIKQQDTALRQKALLLPLAVTMVGLYGRSECPVWTCASLSTTNEDVWGSGGIAPPFLTSALDEGEWSVSDPGLLIPKDRVSDTHLIG
jgi:hypothetical protein